MLFYKKKKKEDKCKGREFFCGFTSLVCDTETSLFACVKQKYITFDLTKQDLIIRQEVLGDFCTVLPSVFC